MRGLVVTPGERGSLRVVDDLPEPAPDDGAVLVEAVAVGVCGTDAEIAAGEYGTAPRPDAPLVIGHESLGRVVDDPTGTFHVGDLVAGIVRRPDPEPCPNCAVGEWDMCRNGRYTECGIVGRDGFARERWRIEPEFAVPLGPELATVGTLLEPTSVVAKAWEHIEHIGARARWQPRTVLVTGAGPIGLLAALLGVQRGLEVHVLDHNADGPKPDLARRLGVEYHAVEVGDLKLTPDVVVECTGAPPVIGAVLAKAGANGVVCLTGVSSPGRRIPLDIGAVNRDLVLDNGVVFGSVNANRRHWEAAAGALARADTGWLESLVTRRLPLEEFAAAFDDGSDDVKVVLEIGG
jgi:threonine dehydrogenase-like Zn-dependent dehydrogenase